MIRMPKTVKVGPHEFEITRIAASQLVVDGDKCLGTCHIDENRIRIAKGLRLSKAQETLLHELLHACVTPVISHLKRPTEEMFVDTCAPTLMQVLRDNPELVEYLTQ